MSRFNFRNHIFKAVGAAAGVLSGLGFFGLVFGLIAGVFLDQLAAGLAGRRRLISFINNPSADAPPLPGHIEAAALITGLRLLRDDRAAAAVFSSSFQVVFSKLPHGLAETAAGAAARPDDEAIMELAIFFGRGATDLQKRTLAGLLSGCRRESQDPLRLKIIQAAGLDGHLSSSASDFSASDYEILGLAPGASSREITRVYRKLASQFHPDSSAELSEQQRQIAEEAFLRIKEAYERLSSRPD